MTRVETRNMGHSVFQRLLTRAKVNREDFNLLLSRYGTERFLYRLSISPHGHRFILKGASLFLVWTGQNYRVTRDVDLLGTGDADLGRLSEVFIEICGFECLPDDGMVYIPESLNVESIRDAQEYSGIRVTLTGLLNQARIPLQIGIGFGDAVTPAPEIIEYPTLFDIPAPRMKAYPKYTLIAEKFEAMVRLGFANSRMKDFFDIWLLARLFEFDGRLLGQAIANTFRRRNTALPQKTVFAFTADFFEDHQKQQQWKAFIPKTKTEMPLGELESVISAVSRFIMPVLDGLRVEGAFDKYWLPEQGWTNIN